MHKPGLINQGSTEGFHEERAEVLVRDSIPAQASVAEADGRSPLGTPAGDYVIELDVAAGFLWWWSLYDVIELEGEGTGGMAARSVAPAAAASFPLLSRRAALRAGRHAAHTLSEPDGATTPARAEPRFSPRAVRVGLIVLVAAAAAGAFLAFHASRSTNPRTEVLRAASPLSDIWIRITGPGGAVSYVGHRFLTEGLVSRVTLRKAPTKGFLLPTALREQKLCAATHLIQPGDAPELQKWKGRKVEITIYGKKTSALYCAVLGYGLYLD